MKYLEKIQSLLPLGYLYLILLGLLKQSILYYQLGINILNYSSITDILISPVSDMASKPALTISVVIVILIFIIIQAIIVKNRHKSWTKKILERGKFDAETDKKEIQKFLFPIFALFLSIELLSLFVGQGVGVGEKLVQQISHNTYTCNYRANFNNGKPEEIYVFDKNSSFYFYVTKASKTIKIAPVATITNLELINNPKL